MSANQASNGDDPVVARGPTAGDLRARAVEVERKRAEILEQATAEEWCNGCHQPRKQWGPICAGMTTGDMTHFHSQEWWAKHIERAL